MALSSTSAICAGKTALSRTQNRPMSKRHHRHRLSLGVKAVQTPKKPAETVTTPPASNEDEKEAYPFEKQYKDCACVRFARRRRSCTTTREPISFRFSTRGRETKAYQVQKLSKTRDHIFSETLNYMALFFFWWWFEVLFFSLSLSLSVSLSFFPDKTDATTFSLLHHAQTKPGTRLSRDSPTKTRDG